MWRLSAALTLSLLALAVLADEVFAPTPSPFVECEDQYPDGIEGTWRVDLDWTREEYAKEHPDRPVSELSIGVSQSTITADTVFVEIPNIGTLERKYRLKGGSANRYLLEYEDDAGATRVNIITLELCGLAMETEADCRDDFCERARDEVIDMVGNIGGADVDVEKLKRDAREAPQTQTVPQRIYYRRVLTEESSPR